LELAALQCGYLVAQSIFQNSTAKLGGLKRRTLQAFRLVGNAINTAAKSGLTVVIRNGRNGSVKCLYSALQQIYLTQAIIVVDEIDCAVY
jgi:hypothetical protein